MLLAAATWDGKLNIYRLQQDQSGKTGLVLAARQDFSGPIMAMEWGTSGRIYLAVENRLQVFDPNTKQIAALGNHQAGISQVILINTNYFQGILTTSYDRTIKIWNEQQQQPLKSWEFKYKIYCADCKEGNIIIGFQTEKFIATTL